MAVQMKFLKDGEDFALPTIPLEDIFSSLVIKTHDKIYMATFDIPSAYIHAEIPEDKQILLKLRDKFVDIMCDVNKEHRKNMVIENGKRLLYMRLVRAIYGCIQ